MHCFSLATVGSPHCSLKLEVVLWKQCDGKIHRGGGERDRERQRRDWDGEEEEERENSIRSDVQFRL